MKTVFLAASGSIVKWAYTDIIDSPEIEYCDYPYDFKKGIKKYIFTRRAASITPFFLKKFLYTKYLHYGFFTNISSKEEVLFISTCQYNMYFDTFFQSFIHFLKEMYPKSKYVFYYNDIIETCYPECIDMIKQEFDLVLTFDKGDAERYDLEYYGEVYSKNTIKRYDDIKPFDAFFVGSDRHRFDIIMKTFKKLADLGQKVVYYIFDVLPDNRNRFREYLADAEYENDKISYKNSVLYIDVYCPYQRTLALIDKCKYMVEITLSAQNAATLRLLEATVYNKKLITNCRAAEEKPYFSKNNVLFFTDIDKVDNQKLLSFLNSPSDTVDYDFSPLKMVEYCKHRLTNEA